MISDRIKNIINKAQNIIYPAIFEGRSNGECITMGIEVIDNGYQIWLDAWENNAHIGTVFQFAEAITLDLALDILEERVYTENPKIKLEPPQKIEHNGYVYRLEGKI